MTSRCSIEKSLVLPELSFACLIGISVRELVVLSAPALPVTVLRSLVANSGLHDLKAHPYAEAADSPLWIL